LKSITHFNLKLINNVKSLNRSTGKRAIKMATAII
jgi:hypothetical protein